MTLEDLIKPESVLCNAHARSKKHCLEILSELLSRPNPEIPNEEIFAKLVERERLGCTGLSKGTAFPRCRIEGIEHCTGALMRLSEPVDFDSADGEMVDIVVGLIVPANLDESHYADLEHVTQAMNQDSLRQKLRDATTSNDLYQALIGEQDRSDSELQSASTG